MYKLSPIFCKNCGNKFQPDLSKRIYCSRKCSLAKSVYHLKGNKNPLWTGKRRSEGYKRKHSAGYWEIWHNGKFVGEHRLIYEKHFGKILPNVHIHHINGIKTDNRIENLVALTKAQHNTVHKTVQAVHAKRDNSGRFI